MDELISIIVPVYNVKEYLTECINSILGQTYRNIEIIIVDDGSNDESADICDEFERIDSRIKVIHQQNQGLAYARNTGLQFSKGKYISFIDSDDYIEKDFIEVLYNLIKQHNVKISLCQIKILKDGAFSHGSTNLLNRNGELINGKDCIFNTYVWNKLYDADIWKDRKFDIGKYYEDIYITYQIMYGEENVAVTDKELYVYRKRTGSISNNLYDVDKTKDFLEASMQRMHFFENKEKYLYDKSVDRYLGAIRQYYGALYANDKLNYKADMKKLVKAFRRMYFTRLFKSRFGIKSHLKNIIFITMPNIFAIIKNN